MDPRAVLVLSCLTALGCGARTGLEITSEPSWSTGVPSAGSTSADDIILPRSVPAGDVEPTRPPPMEVIGESPVRVDPDPAGSSTSLNDLGTCSEPLRLTGAHSTIAVDELKREPHPFDTGCGGAGGIAVFTWTAPSAGRFTFDTFESEFDTVFAVYDGDGCSRRIACNDDAKGGPHSVVAVDLSAFQVVTLVVKAAEADDEGWFRVSVQRDPRDTATQACSALDLGSAQGLVVDDASLGDAALVAANECFGAGSALTYTWTAPSTASYEFSTKGSDFDTVLVVRPDACVEEQIACNDDFYESHAALRLFLEQGERIAIDVTSYRASRGDRVVSFDLGIQAIIR